MRQEVLKKNSSVGQNKKSPTKSEVMFDKLVDAKESYTAKKVRAPKPAVETESKQLAKAAVAFVMGKGKPKSNDNLGPERPAGLNSKPAQKAKPARSKREASISVWKNPAFRAKITAAIKAACARRKAAAAQSKPKPKAKVAAQVQAQA
jgi:hypothetical protein